MRVFVGNQVTLIFRVLHCHLLAEDEKEVKSIQENVHREPRQHDKKHKMKGDSLCLAQEAEWHFQIADKETFATLSKSI